MNEYFDFEKSIEVIDDKIKILESNNEDNNLVLIKKYNLEKKNLLKKIYSSLTSWQKVRISRHSNRPHMLDYVDNIFSNFIPLSGDKKFAEDKAIVGGLATIDDLSVMIIGNEKGNSMEKRIEHNFGMAKPEGFRKAQRLMVLAEKLKLPLVTFVDTAGAFPGKEAEERGQSESIASSISQCLKVKTPIISIIIGEGGSGGAIALATADRILMLQNSIFSVISPEGCASILWRNTDAVQKAAKSLKLTAEDCLELNIIDGIVEEMPGGAHRYPKEQFVKVKKTIIENLADLRKLPVEKIVADRNEKFLNITLN